MRPTLVAATADLAVVIAGEPSSQVLARCRKVLATNPDLDELLDALQSEGRGRTPDFACVSPQDALLRVILRGAVRVRLLDESGTGDPLSAPEGLTTWREELVGPAGAVVIELEDQEVLLWSARRTLPSASGVPVARPAESEHADAGGTAQLDGAQPDHTLGDFDHVGDIAASVNAPDEHGDAAKVPRESSPEPAPDVTRLRPADGAEGPIAPLPPPPFPGLPVPVPPATDADGPVVGRDDPSSEDDSQPPEEASTSGSTTTAAGQSGGGDGAASDPGMVPEAADDPVRLAHDEPVDRGMSQVSGAAPLISSVPTSDQLRSPTEVPDSSPAPPAVSPGDHDGRTVARAHVDALLAKGQPGQSPGPVEGIPGVLCPAGHPNPPQTVACRTCGVMVSDPSVRPVPRPVVARLRFDDGNVIELDRPQIVGRRPTVPKENDLGPLVGLHAVPDEGKELSRNHIEVRLEGWSMTVVDLGSLNGTWVAHPGKEPERIRSHVPYTVVIGSTVRLASVTSFTVEPPA